MEHNRIEFITTGSHVSTMKQSRHKENIMISSLNHMIHLNFKLQIQHDLKT